MFHVYSKVPTRAPLDEKLFEELGIFSRHYVITEFVGKYGLEWMQSQPGKAEHLGTCRYGGNGGCMSALTKFD